MNPMVINFFSPFIGLLLGCLFFGGLWFTVKKGIHASMPGLLFVFSFILRTSMVLVVFYFLAKESAVCLLLVVIGFVLSKPLVGYLTKLYQKGGSHEA
jgi:F1F0 ATPase subunit 2